jgi:serine/threonine-protein kinase RsbW
MPFEAFLIALDAALARELEQGLGEQRASLRPLAAPRQLLEDGEAVAMPRVVVAIEDAARLDPAWWRALRSKDPQAQLLVACRTCADETWRRWLVLGASNVLRPPFLGIDLEAEFSGEPALSAVFRRHPGLAAHGKTLFRYTFPSDPQYIPGVVHAVALLALEFGFPPADVTMNLPLAVDEAVSNAIIHGNKRDQRKRVEVEGQIDGELLRLKVRDEGDGFQHDRSHSPVDPENLLSPSGRGLFLIESVMDAMRFTQDGRCIEMQKRIRRSAPR